MSIKMGRRPNGYNLKLKKGDVVALIKLFFNIKNFDKRVLFLVALCDLGLLTLTESSFEKNLFGMITNFLISKAVSV